MSRVLITGCGLTLSEDFRIWGDLWEEGNCFIFNACGDEEGLPEPFDDNINQLVLMFFDESYFQRRNVFVLSKDAACLNKIARSYVEAQR